MKPSFFRHIRYAVFFRGLPLTLLFFIISLPDSLHVDIGPGMLIIIFFIGILYSLFFEYKNK